MPVDSAANLAHWHVGGIVGEARAQLARVVFRVGLQKLPRSLCVWINRFHPALTIMGFRFAI